VATFRVFLLNDPEDIERVLVTDHDRFMKGRALGGARRIFGQGLLTSDGDLHQRQRRLIQPAFRRMKMADYARTMTALAAECHATWSEEHTMDIAHEMNRLTLAIAGRMLFGADGDELLAPLEDQLPAVDDLLEVPVLPLAALTDFLPLRRTRRLRRTRATLDNLLSDIIERRRRDRSDRGDMLTALMGSDGDEPAAVMPEVQLRDELITLLLAGHDTTANALAWAWFLLGQHPEVERRLHAEIDAVAGRRAVEADDLPELPFARAVFGESMRLYPPAWLIGRVTVSEYDAKGYTIPSGSLVVVSPWVLHRNRAYFPEPDRFDPDRWLGEEHKRLPRFAYFPFGGGPRGCMGEAFAWMEGVLLLAAIAQRWRFRLLDARAPDMLPALTLKPKGGIRVVPERRL
jgi:cytochrome P450